MNDCCGSALVVFVFEVEMGVFLVAIVIVACLYALASSELRGVISYPFPEG